MLVVLAAFAIGLGPAGFAQDPAGLARVVSTNLSSFLGTGRLVRAEGIVLLQARPNRLYCLDGTGPLRVQLRSEGIYPFGERLQIDGMVTAADGGFWITQATVRRLGKDSLPPPVEATLEQAHSNRLDAIRLSIRGTVLGHQFAPSTGFGRETVVVDDQTGEGHGFFQVRLPKGTGIRTRFPTGSSIRAVGLSIVETGTPDCHIVSVYPASVEDVEVLSRPFWSEPSGKVAASVAGGGLLIGAAWVLVQRRQFRLVQNSEERLRALSEHSFDATCVLDHEGSVKFMTPAARRFIGSSKPEEAATRDGFFQSMHPDDVPRIMETLETVLRAPGASRRISGYRIRMPDRSIRWVESIVSNCLDVPGVEGVVVNLHDITEQTEAFQGLARAADLQRHLNDFATALSPLTDEREVLGDVIRKCISHLGFADCVIYLTDPERGMLVQAAALGPKDHGGGGVLNPIEVPIGRGIVGAAAESGQTIIVGDTRKDPRYIVDDAVRLSEIAVPILSEGKVLGVIDSEHPRVGFFTQDHASILGSIAFLCANKIIRARTDRSLQELNRGLERRIEERTSELRGTNDRLTLEIAERTRAESVQRALFGISEAVHSAEDLAHLYARIHAIIGTLMPATNFYLALLDPVTGIVSFPYHRDETDPPSEPRKDRRGMTEYVLRTGRPTLAGLDEIQRLKDEGEYEQTGHPAAVWLGVPLQYQGRTFGVMAVQDHHDPEAFDAEDKRLLNFVAGQTALAIERKRSEEQLRERTRRLHESEERFRRTFSALPSNVSLVRLSDQTFVEVNEAVITSTGFSREEFLGKTTGDLRLWVVEAERTEFFRRLEQDGRVRAMEAAMRAKSGRIDIVLISAERLEVEGEPHILTLSINISERKQAEQELLRSLARERELSRLKSEFVSLVSHEFRTPIGIIHSSAEILERYLDRIPVSERLEHLRAIQSHSWRMASLMEAVLVFGRAEAGKLEFQAMDFDLGPSVQRWVDEFLRASQVASPVQVTAADLPRKAHGDPDLLRHVVTNLLSNAVKFSPAGAGVTIVVHRDGVHAVIRVEDRGAGIPESDRELLFTAFHRGSNVRHVPGTGLGLAVIRRCLDLHHGTIRIDSTEGTGTSVTVQIPLFTAEPSP